MWLRAIQYKILPRTMMNSLCVYFSCILFDTNRIFSRFSTTPQTDRPPFHLVASDFLSGVLVSILLLLIQHSPLPPSKRSPLRVSCGLRGWPPRPSSLPQGRGAPYAHGFFICGCLRINVPFLPPRMETMDRHFFSPLLISSCFSLCLCVHLSQVWVFCFFKSLSFLFKR